MGSLRRLAFIVVLGLGIGALSVPDVARANDGHTYVVVSGDTLIGIASESGVRLSELLRANDLRITSLILPGQRLEIPASGSSPSTGPTSSGTTSATPSGATHTVRWGDTLSGIAARHRVSLSSLLKANGMTVSSLIFPGTKLAVPGGSGSSGSTPAPSGASSSPAAASGSSGSSHAVRAGDTLSGIASKYGVSLGSLLTVNSMSVTSLIVPGMRLALPGGASSAGGPSRSSAPSPASSGVAAVVDYALAQVGKPYRFFAKGPDAFDCSGLTLAAYQQIGIDLIHYSAYQAKRGAAVDFRNESIRPGDLVFQARRGSATINHVGIAITSTTWVQAVGTGSTVKLGPMPSIGSITEVRRMVGN